MQGYDRYEDALRKLMDHANKHKWSNKELDDWMNNNRQPELFIVRVRKLTGDKRT